jgi:CDP-glycerol glycerophosphotransferase (TagB/SpsB family)
LLRKILSFPLIILFKFFLSNFLSNKNNLIIIPDVGSEYNQDSIVNYSSDNSLKLLRYILDNNHFNNKKIFLVNFVESHTQKIIQYLKIHKNVIVIDDPYQENKLTLYFFKYVKYLIYFSSSAFIINSNVLNRYRYKNRNQKIFSLNYYTPFKYDKPLSKKICEIEYVISTSKISSKYVSKTSLIKQTNFYELGFPRHDSLFNPILNKKEIIKSITGSDKFIRIIVYTPTHRDYERDSKLERNLFGKSFSANKINELLKKTQTIIVVKSHSNQNNNIVKDFNFSNIFMHQPNINYSLYDLLGVSDALITDYSSVYFDYLQLNKPVFFYFYDYEKYINIRGFMYDNILEYCAGEISYNVDELFASLENFLLLNNDVNLKKRKDVNRIFNTNQKNNTKRIFQFIKNKIK